MGRRRRHQMCVLSRDGESGAPGFRARGEDLRPYLFSPSPALASIPGRGAFAVPSIGPTP